MDGFRFLKHEDLFGENSLKIFDYFEKQGTITDFYILTGGKGHFYNDRFNVYGMYWTNECFANKTVSFIEGNGKNNYADVDRRIIGIRPCIDYSLIKDKCKCIAQFADEVFGVEYGEYPQNVVNEKFEKELFDAFNTDKMKSTGKTYTVDYNDIYCINDKFEPCTFDEYTYKGRKFILFYSSEKCVNERLLDRRMIEEDSSHWVEIKPIEWIVDTQKDIAVSRKILCAGVRYDDKLLYSGIFKYTEMKMFLDTYFAKDIIPSKIISKSVVNTTKKTRLQKLNPDTNIENKRKMTDTELIKMWIDNGESVLLRGPSGIGKTERIKTLYPNLIYIKLTNNMFPEKVVGSVNLQTGEELPPSFAKEIILSLATEEEKKQVSENIRELYNISNTIYERTKSSNEKIVILLDELLNVKPAVQSLVYTLVLNKLVETGKGLKLPANTVIVATGNQKKYSSVAEDLAEPLEKRFDHILDMYPKVNEWINEYAIPNKVHPSVIGYILSKYRENMRNNTIDYFYEEPEVGEYNLDKNGCKGKTNDPRGWVSISNFLYGFEHNLSLGKFIGKDVEEILKVSLKTKLREEWAEEFYDFYNIPVLTVEEVVSNNFTQADLPVDTNERFALVTSLINASNEEVGICREFIRKYCDPEYLSIYDLCWIGNSIEKAEIISELQSSAKSLVKTINKVGQ